MNCAGAAGAYLHCKKKCKSSPNWRLEVEMGHCKQVNHHSQLSWCHKHREPKNCINTWPDHCHSSHNSQQPQITHFTSTTEPVAPFPSVLHQEQPQTTSISWSLPKPIHHKPFQLVKYTLGNLKQRGGGGKFHKTQVNIIIQKHKLLNNSRLILKARERPSRFCKWQNHAREMFQHLFLREPCLTR